jgi:glycosyltransferase involved in cell wall biosynthesis
MSKPLVSALIDTYNQGRYLEQALVSVLEQGLSPEELEIVVVDDGSTDETPSIVQKFLPRVRYLRKKNGGQASAFNAAIPETHAPIISFLDADDWWAPGKLHAVLEEFSKNPDIPAVGHAFYDTREDGTPTELVAPDNVSRISLSTPEETRVAASLKCCLATSKLSLRRWVMDRMGPIPEQLVSCADDPIMNAALALGGAILIDRPLCYYRYHSGNMFGFDSRDPARNRKRYEVQAFLAKYLPELLGKLGVSSQSVQIILDRFAADIERFEALQDGGRRQIFRMEMRSFRRESRNPSAGYLLFKAAVGALTLLLPPARFYQVRDWYAKKNIRRFREAIGNAEPAFPEVCRRVPLLKQD